MIALALRLLSVWQWIKRMVASYPWQAALVLALAWGAYERWQHVTWHDYARSILAAQKQATADQTIINQRPAQITGAIAMESNAQAPAYLRSLRAAADAHAVRLRPPASPTSDSAVRGPDPAGAGVDRPDQHTGEPGAELVCRPAAEDRWIIGAVGRFAQMHADAEAMIAAGVAVPSD